MSSFMKSFLFKNNFRKYTILSLVLLLSLSGVIVYSASSYPSSLPSGITNNDLLITKINNFFGSSCSTSSGVIIGFNSDGTVNCGNSNPNINGITAASGTVSLPASSPGGNKDGTLMGAMRKFLNSSCSVGEYIVGTKSDGSKACGSNTSSVANLAISNQGIIFPVSVPSGQTQSGTLGSKINKFFNSTCPAGQYLAGVGADGGKRCAIASYPFCTAGGTVPCITPEVINGVCGSSNLTNLTSIPTVNLCSVGTASSIVGSGPWNWSCTGSNGGTTASCSANKVIINSVNGIAKLRGNGFRGGGFANIKFSDLGIIYTPGIDTYPTIIITGHNTVYDDNMWCGWQASLGMLNKTFNTGFQLGAGGCGKFYPPNFYTDENGNPNRGMEHYVKFKVTGKTLVGASTNITIPDNATAWIYDLSQRVPPIDPPRVYELKDLP